MDANFNDTEKDINENDTGANTDKAQRQDDGGINRLSMDDKGNIIDNRNGTMAIAESSRIFIILSWISAALTAFISPYFAIAGITFGVLANRRSRGSGNTAIITNIVLAVFSLLFGLFFIAIIRRMMLGY